MESIGCFVHGMEYNVVACIPRSDIYLCSMQQLLSRFRKIEIWCNKEVIYLHSLSLKPTVNAHEHSNST